MSSVCEFFRESVVDNGKKKSLVVVVVVVVIIKVQDCVLEDIGRSLLAVWDIRSA